MFLYYLKSAVRNLWINKKFTIINITGFAFAISVCLAIALFLTREYSFDRFNEHVGQIVRLIDAKDNSSMIDYRVKDLVINNFPEIENGCLVLRSNHPLEVKCGNKGFYLNDIMSVDNDFFEIFSISFLSGQTSSPLVNINSAVVTESTARLLFGYEIPLGKEIMIWGNIPVTITGLIRDFPDNSSITAGLLVNAENEKFKFYQSIGDSRDLSTYRWLFQIYLQLKINSDQEQVVNKINANSTLLLPYAEAVGFLKLKDIYLHDITSGSETKQGNASLLKLLTGIALVILILAIINYVNLTIAQQNQRNKDTGIKKAFGASRANILSYYLNESILVSLLAFTLGLYLVWFMLPFYNAIFDATLKLNSIIRFPNLIILFASILLVGLISGCGPAIIFSEISPVRVLGGNIITPGKKYYFRNSLTVFQFTISIILIFCVIIVQKQICYVKHKNPGFNEEQLLRLDVPNIQEADVQKAMVLLEEYRKSPFVKRVSLSSGVPGEIRLSMSSNMQNSTKNMTVPCLLVDTAFLETFGLKVVKGRNLEPGDYGKVCMINEAAYRHFEFADLENKRFNNYGGFDITGVVNDFQFTSLHKTIGPVCIIFTPNSRPTAINIRFARNGTGPGMDMVRKLWDEILPGYPLKYQFYDEWFDSLYRSEERFAKTIGLFAILAIIISCIGILGLVTFASERRTKEIGIRKVNGAKIFQVIILLNKEFMIWVAIAFMIGTPVMYFSMQKWLSNFAYKTTLSWWIFALSGAIALGIALITVSWQSWRAAARNPVETLRYE
ncbi:MAG: ABC transporter permease [Bacteroidales bacterium]|nr:ABC transporter permease [Bacteroidales bacterium]